MTGEIQQHTEAEVARWHQLKDVIRRNKEDALEWIKAVREAQKTALWMCQYATWDDFCRRELGLPARAVRGELQLGQGDVSKPPALPPPTATDYAALRDHSERLVKRLKTFVEGYVKLTDQWPETELAAGKLREFDEELLRWVGEFELWAASQGSGIEAARKLESRVLTRKKRKRKKV
jgi:hypothetical protein